MGLGMTRNILILAILFISATFAQSETLTSKSDTNKINESNPNEIKANPEFKPLSLTYLRMSNPLTDMNLNSDPLFYSQSFLLPSQFKSPFDLSLPDMINPLRPRVDPTMRTVRQILDIAGTAAAFGVAAYHVKKYWHKYKQDFGIK